MEEPKIADTKPIAVDLAAGKTYFFCSCGHAAEQPFCDGSHKGKGFAPQSFKAEKDGTAYLCQCKHSKNMPYCDGSHKGL